MLLLLLIMVGERESWAYWRNDIAWQAINRISNDGGTFTTASNAANTYALALVDLSGIDGIGTVGTVNIQFYCYIPGDSRWMIGFGDKNVRGMTANGSNKDNYNTDGLYLRFGENKGNNTFNVNGVETAGSPAIDKWLRVNFSFNRIAHTYSYSIEDAGTGIPYYSGYDLATSVSSPTIIEAYSWMNGTHADLHNVTVTFGDFYFPHGAEIAYIEDLSYTLPLFNGTGKTPSYTFSTTSYFRQNGTTLYPKTTTGSDPSNLWEGDPIAITANTDGEQPTTYYLRFKTRSWIDPASLCTSNTFDAGTTLGMFSSNTVTLDGMTLSFSKDADIPVVRSINGDYGVTIIDGNGYNFGNIDGNGILWGTVYKIETTAAKKLHVTGYFSDYGQDCVLLQGTTQVGTIANPRNETLATGTFDLEANKTYYLYATPYSTFALKSLSYTDAYFEQSYAITDIPADGHYQQTVTDMAGPVYSIVGVAGDLVGKSVTINSATGQLSGITASGAIKVQAAGGGKTVYYVLTVAYPATDYPGHVWNFYENQGGLNTSDGLKAVPVPTTTTTDSHGDVWTAIYKNAMGEGRNPVWYHNNPVEGDNAFIVEETAGLVFQTGYQRFYLRNDNEEFTHVGIRDYNASLTIPRLQEGDIVEIMWRHDASGSGSQFTATNVKDLRGKVVNEEFEITESAERTKTRYVGAYSFIATGGDVTFTLRDNGNCDIQSVRIYKGPYRPTMRDINLSGNEAAPTTMLLDNAPQGYTYNYCNQLYSTATGPAMYVLKGFRPYAGSGTLGVDYDDPGCVTGANAAYNPTSFTDVDAYPVSDEEKTRLYELRKNIVGLEMYNDTWKSSRNSYNNGVIKATSGWGKITIRMNNYTNDMKYVIGYTPDYTLTIGSKPHQTYPYTWDFTKIAGQRVTGQADNVLYSIEAEGSNDKFSGAAPTNWFKNGNGLFMLNTDNSGDLGSQYVPGAVLVTQDRALSNFNGVEYEDKWAKDELDGLGFDGGITMHIDHLPSNVASGWNRAAVEDQWNSLLSFKITDAVTFNRTGGTDEDPIGTWEYSQDLQNAGSGQIQLNYGGEGNPIDESSIPAGGIGYRLDEGNTKYIRVMPSSPLQAGDVISVTAYNAYSYRDAGISFNRSASEGDVAQSKLLTKRLIEETIDYTVTTNDGLDGRDGFYLFRNTNTVHITAIEISRKASTIPNLDWSIYTLTKTTITVPDLNAEGKQDWIYVSASTEPVSVTNATTVTEAADGPDANTGVYKYKVTAAGNALLTFTAGTKIYKIGVTHILKDIHQVGSTGWATEIRKQKIDYQLTGYFTKNDVNAYTVKYDSYDLNTATVALTPINEDGYVPEKTGVVMKLDNAAGLSAANAGKNVPLFYPSYTRSESSTPVDFPTNNWMYNVDEGIDRDNQNYNETIDVGDIDYTKFVLTNVHWTFHQGKTAEDETKSAIEETDAAGFYRLHIWQNDASKNVMPAHNAFLLVPTDNLPIAVWNLSSAGVRSNTLGIRTLWGGDATAIEDVEIEGRDGQPSVIEDGEGAWYTLSGMRLQSRPTVSGMYIHNGKKVVINLRTR